jgi:transposase
LLYGVTAAAGVASEAGAASVLSPEEMLAQALEANAQLSELVSGFLEDNAMLRQQVASMSELMAGQAAELERARADLAVLQRLLFGRSSEKGRPEPPAGDDGDAPGGGSPSGGKKNVKRGPGARAGRRDYSHLPRVEVIWDFPGGGYCCEECGEPFTLLGTHLSGEQVDWQVIVKVVAHCQRRYKRACRCPGAVTVMAAGPPKAIGKGRFTNGFTAMLLVERYEAGRSANSLVTGLARQGAEISPSTLAGTVARAGALLAPLEAAIAERSRQSWHLHADETTWRVFCPDGGTVP